MGSRFEFTAVARDSTSALAGIEAGIKEVRRIEKLISSWDLQSQTSKVNDAAGLAPVVVDKELYDLVKRSKKISELTQGAFDISYASMDKIWKFDGSVQSLPAKGDIAQSVSSINYQNVILDPGNVTIFLKEKGMKIGFGAIGKGYAANRAKAVMQNHGIENGVVNAGGDLITWGQRDNNKSWRIGIADPKDKTKMISWLDVSDMAVVTSGNYEKYVIIDGQRYAHIIDPRTGMPAKGLKSVTIICTDAELADALATSVFVLGKENGLHLIDQLKGIEGLLITDTDEMITTKNLHLNYYKNQEADYDFKLRRE